MNGRGSESFSLEQILFDLLDQSESVRGHALIKLAKGIRQKNKQFLDEITASSAIMRIILGQLLNYSISLFFCSTVHVAVIICGIT